ncbi:Zinc finger CCHC-type superfamily [Arabidopsis suecica]|uniref:Zinc finger CCHC-type superfamily n=1 Tax=Arabidopsis suecica TaxID=45249 RepID=A0A8T2BU78_ARASU|nr:Zinc finger CCHC-type superfamily [Arabidopsis suecica]
MQKRVLNRPTVANAEAEIEAQRKWQILAKAEESFFCQRSSISWLKDGDSNTSYFHRMVASRKTLNHIHFIQEDGGPKIDSQQGIRDHCVDFFHNLIGSEVGPNMLTQGDMNILLPFRCNRGQKENLEMPFSSEEIREAFFSLPRNKSSGPDGFSAEFFTGCWSVIGLEVIEAVSEFFTSGSMLKQWNATTLVLIPKLSNASKAADFRPISCLNTLYKVISKLLAKRLQQILSKVISSSQSAFMPGRLLGENVLLATEIVHGYNRKNIDPRAMLKVDLRKAFDSVRWDFILSALRALNIPEKFVNWICQCITTPSFSICVNGESGGFFKSTTGLRQGDPLSPYLFVLAMEVFSSLLKARFDAGYIHYHPQTSDLQISHLMFADDVMIFFDGGSSSLHGINEALDDFASWSGLCMNRGKTQLFCAGQNHLETTAIARFGFPIGSLPIRYLGLPLMHRKLRISEYEPLIDNLIKKFRNWAVKTLSFVGRLQLLGSVISGVVNFWISTFILPQGCIKKIESLCSRFLWKGNIDMSNGVKVSWASVCLPKDEGGLGLRRYAVWNKALCLRLRPLAERFLRSKVGNGIKTSFWFDFWTPLGPLIKLLGSNGPRDLRIPLNCCVASACSGAGWSLPAPRSDEALSLHVHLTTAPLPSTIITEDYYYWETDGTTATFYSSAKTWEALRPRQDKKDWVNSVWYKGEGTSMRRPPLLDSANYGYWKVRMQAFISNLDEDCWNSIELGWEAPKVTDDEGVVSLKPRDKWTAVEKRLSSCNSKAKTAIYNAIDSSRFKLISQCASAQKAWKTLENMFEGTTSVKRTKLDMLASQFENLRMEEEETVADFSAKLCDISNESFALGKVYKDKKLVKKLKRSLPAKFESKISAVEEAHNLDEMAFDEFVGILQAFELSKAYEAKGRMKKIDEVKKEVDIGVAHKGSSTEDSMAMLSRQFTKYPKKKGKGKKDRIDEELRSSSKNVQCFECKRYGHVRSECANLQKHKKKAMNVVSSDSETDSDDEEELKNFVAFTNFLPETATESASASATESASASATESASSFATGSASVSATGPALKSENDECDSDAESVNDEEFAENYRALYEHWLKMVEENSVLTKEKFKLEAKVVEAQKYAAEKEEEASQAKVQLEETQKNLKMLNNGTKKLDHILNIGKTDKCGL